MALVTTRHCTARRLACASSAGRGRTSDSAATAPRGAVKIQADCGRANTQSNALLTRAARHGETEQAQETVNDLKRTVIARGGQEHTCVLVFVAVTGEEKAQRDRRINSLRDFVAILDATTEWLDLCGEIGNCQVAGECRCVELDGKVLARHYLTLKLFVNFLTKSLPLKLFVNFLTKSLWLKQ